jgi:hypothetical protein
MFSPAYSPYVQHLLTAAASDENDTLFLTNDQQQMAIIFLRKAG